MKPLVRLRLFFWTAATALCGISVWASRDHMDPDSISYLDIGDAYFRHDWHSAINGLWSPLFSWIVAAFLHLFRPTPYWEFPVVHLVVFFVYLLTLACFEFFLRALIRYHGEALPAWAWMAIGYPLFIWSSIRLIWISNVGPDHLVAAVCYLASALLLRVSSGNRNWTTFATFGALLGIGYLAKAPMFPLAFIFIFTAYLSSRGQRGAIKPAIVSLLTFFALAAPLVTALSVEKKRLTFGDSGRDNYAFYIDGLNFKGSGCEHCDYFVHWEGGPDGIGKPLHPTREILSSPAIYEFSTPVAGTYPPWYDPSYWYDGLKPRFELGGQLRILWINASTYFNILVAPVNVAILVGFLTLALLAGSVDLVYPLLIPAAAAFAMYWPVHVESRYVGGFIVLFWLGLFSGLKPSDRESFQKLTKPVVAAVSIGMMLCLIVPELQHDFYNTLHDMLKEDANAHAEWKIADGLSRMGLRAGDEVACIGMLGINESWARLDRVRIVAELPDPKQFWAADATTQQKVISIFRTMGVKALITSTPGLGTTATGWTRIGKTDRYVYFLEPPASAAPHVRL